MSHAKIKLYKKVLLNNFVSKAELFLLIVRHSVFHICFSVFVVDRENRDAAKDDTLQHKKKWHVGTLDGMLLVE